MRTSKVIAIHLLNDFSGSPFVLRQSLEALVKRGYEVELLTATPEGSGFLSDIDGVKHSPIFYKWSPDRWMTLILFLYSQCALFFKILFKAKKRDIIYVNSLLPFGAALAARLKRATVLYHIHEVSIKPALLKTWLLAVANLTAHKAIFVSKDLQERTAFKKPATVIYNALPAAFIQQALATPFKKADGFSVLMLCSLKKYKGVDEFVTVASLLPRFRFTLVLNASAAAIAEYFKGRILPPNLELVPSQQDVHPYYRNADVVMNLSRPDEWVETFGMTILEAMYYSKPVIVPPVGGVKELVTPGREGYQIDCRQVNNIAEKLQWMATSPSYYRQLSLNAHHKALQFSPVAFAAAIVYEMENLSTIRPSKSGPVSIQLGLF